mmetsp:Transcript_16493/g.34653  ORF Transcript_16493/g.34653 Transcript_16493/m.34653 type:complete len:820 (-) Transcript_16493:297-2756(-)
MGTTSSKSPQRKSVDNDHNTMSPTSAGIFPLPPSKPSSSTSSSSLPSSMRRRREVEMPTKPYRDDPSRCDESTPEPPPPEEEGEGLYSFLPPHRNDDTDGYIGPAVPPYRSGGLRGRLRADLAICTAAFSQLSKTTRAAALLMACGLISYGAHRLVETPTAANFVSGLTVGREKDFGYEGRVLTKAQLKDTQRAARKLVDLLHHYYGGETTAENMLMRSWQAQWKLDLNEYLENEEEDGDETAVWDDDDDFGDDFGDGDDSNGDSHRHRDKHRHLGNKYVKQAKVIHNHPDNLTPDQIQQQKHHSKQRTTKLITTMARALLNPHQDYFKIGTLGSSVTAGHENCHYDSYQSQLERTLSPVFQPAGLTLSVQNAGEAGCGDSHENQVFCLAHNLSPDVDILHYSWTYSEHGGGQNARESLIRWGQQLPRRPMVHQLVARGMSNTCEGNSKDNVMLNNAYAAYGYNAFCIQTGLYFGGYDYDREIEKEGINRFGRQQVGDGYHETTRYGESEEDEARKKSLGIVFRNWHPGPLGFQMASDAFAYVYGMGVLMALDLIEKDMNAGLDPRDRWFVKSTADRDLQSAGGEYGEIDPIASFDTGDQNRLRNPNSTLGHLEPQLSLPPQTVDDMPEPLFCNPLYCSIPHPPSCLNYENPTFGVPGPTVRNQNSWTISHDDNDWTFGVGASDIAIFKRRNDDEWFKKCSHLDACGTIAASDSSQGELIFELPASNMTTGLIIVCGCCGNNVGETMFLKNENLEIKLNRKVLNKSKMDVYPNEKCVRLVKAFKEFDKSSDISKEDEMLMSFHLKKNANEVKISHLIFL